jgi:hypothetical protein
MVLVSISQLVKGIPPESALYDAIKYPELLALNACFIIGGVFGLIGGALNRDKDDIRLSLRFGIMGQLSICAASAFYALLVTSITENGYWLSVLSSGISGGIAYAAGHRLIQQWRALRWTNRAVKLVRKIEKGGYEVAPPEDGTA